MKITAIRASKEDLGLIRPYTIAFKTVNSVSVSYLELELENGTIGLGSSNPSAQVVGETLEDTLGILQKEENLEFLIGRDIREYRQLIFEIGQKFPHNPGVKAALDIAVHDAFSKFLGLPLVQFFGQKIKSMPTSITIGIKSVEETMEEAKEYVGRGFKILKIKLGKSLEEDIERVMRIYEMYGARIVQRVDANQGYSGEQVQEFYKKTAALDLELIEQPVDADNVEALRKLPDPVKKLIAVDESLIGPKDAFALASPPVACGIFNIKLMKCGGVGSALNIATIATNSNMSLMWGCNDESAISISAALHAAFSCPQTRYIDLDGSLDLARDIVEGGFTLNDGVMSLTGEPGLGVKRIK